MGTPEYMAPEYYEESYTEKVDIWAFGLCVLEMITNEYPYMECANPAQVFKKVSAGKLPDSLERVKDERVSEFIGLCLAPASVRPSAADLLTHPFLSANDPADTTLKQPVDLYTEEEAAQRRHTTRELKTK